MRFPIAGIAAGLMLASPGVVVTLLNKKRRRDWRANRFMAAIFCIHGLLLGLLWAVTRLLF
ncbi:MAG: hypothetical protein EX258_01840 [Sphingomonadaceae bacterium]|nr:MAG: hypothetical protein EX258_01840 [Sphingomonadaceae bacterium]